MIEIECTHCENTYSEYKSRISESKNNFCCSDCYQSWQQKDNVTITCSWCGDTKNLPQSHPSVQSTDNSGYEIENNFCDKSCESQYKSEHWTDKDHPSYDGGNKEVVCEECGDTYTVKPSLVSKTKFCSNECQTSNWTEPMVECTCDWCDTTFERKSHNIKGESVFCSSVCFEHWMSEQQRGDGNPQWVGGKAYYYGENWNEERRKALDNAGYECKLCGMTRDEHYDEYGFDLDVHHRIPLRAFDEPENANFQSNLVVCCRNCHQSKLEADPIPHNDIRAPA